MLEILRKISLFKELTEEQLKLLLKGTNAWLNSGEMLFNQGDPAKHFYVVLEGAVRISREISNREFVLGTYVTGTFFGEVPLLAGTPHPASGLAVCRSHVYSLQEDDFWQMLIILPPIRKAVLGFMASRMQELQMLSRQHERLISLGTLAAGLAHELNNPASAVRQAAGQLREGLQNRHALALRHVEQHLTPAQLEKLLELKHDAVKHAVTSNCFDPLAQIDWEDELVGWLEEHGIADGWRIAPNLVAGGLKTEQLEAIGEQVATDTLSDVLTWLEATLAEAVMLNVLDHGTARISELVKAVKAYSYMDQDSLKDIDLHEGLENTLTILGHKLRNRGVLVIREYAQNLPCIRADGSALNQVWTNLIDNAIDAIASRFANDVLDEQGTVWVRTSVEKDYVVVEIADNGSGIPPEIQPRIFEPFFTTKRVGTGTGLGLDIAYRIVGGQYNGSLRCFSKPGYTRFLVRMSIRPFPPAQT
jgi:signal transduction histidine kinase